ncbi:MBL fold metallo-hydrolase [Tropicimonas sp. IMCC34043]|uniref:MBL fold metallo-hydrolase n=1 Tax=Tropicimonas sp. IMCC34043 TaxID=2248760 RepID=UPI000E23DECF|nr:MBL fold metallo-hydrolase [Tropicimonas sp. IMCC34043]
MTLTRRRMLQASLAGAFLPLVPRWARAEIALGDMRIDTLSDGHLVLPPDFIFGPMPQQALPAVLAPFHISLDTPLLPDCNLTLLRRGEDVVLFDAGAGLTFQDTAGKLPAALDAIGLAPEEVTHVIFTHGHPDHLWGVLDDFDEPFFANAQHMMGKTEWDFWIDPQTADRIDAARTTFAIGARRRLEAMEDAMLFFADGEEILPGVAARMTPGHTPGHMSFELRSGSESLMVLGDAISNHHVAFARPDWPSGSDQDTALAAATRVALLDQIAAMQMPVIGFHLPGGGLGRAERDGSSYRFVAEGE